MGKPWFGPKTIGFGGTPNTWQGWLATLIYLALIIWARPLTVLMFGPGKTAAIAYPLFTGSLTIAFVILARRKSSDAWRWQNGQNRAEGAGDGRKN